LRASIHVDHLDARVARRVIDVHQHIEMVDRQDRITVATLVLRWIHHTTQNDSSEHMD
jgi:hypothetical protein